LARAAIGRHVQNSDVAEPSSPHPRACLTFDFDALSPWLAAATAAKAALNYSDLSRGEFAARVGVPRILALLDTHSIQSTWFVPGHTIDTYPDLCRAIHAAGHEIAHHGYLHEAPVDLSRADEEIALRRGIEACERHLGERPRGYRAPRWALSADSVELLAANGFLYDSSMMGDDFSLYRCRTGDAPYVDRGYGFGAEVDLVEVPVSWSLTDYPLFELLLHPGVLAVLAPHDAVRTTWLADFDYMCASTDRGVFTLTLHPETIGRGARMRLLEDLIVAMKDRAATFHRADALAADWRATRPFTGADALLHP
jgi:peptidoglycan-N-acetylglucosamine deacetylase